MFQKIFGILNSIYAFFSALPEDTKKKIIESICDVASVIFSTIFKAKKDSV